MSLKVKVLIATNSFVFTRKLTNGSSLSATGRLLQSTGHQQPVELLIETIEVLGQCNPKTYEIGHLSKDFSLDYLRERIHMRPRVRYFQAVLRLRSELQNAVQIYMKQSEFTNVTTPMVTANDCEGGGECFTLSPAGESKAEERGPTEKHYFGRPTYLTVSGQLHLEALACSMSRVYTLSPVFRAEKSMSPKHLSEFLMLEVEEAFTFSLGALLSRVEAMCKFLAFYLERHCAEDLQYLRAENGEYGFGQAISSGTYARVTYDEAVEVLQWMEPFKEAFQNADEPVNLNAQMERALVELVGNRPLFVTHYPSKMKPFYMKTEGDKVSGKSGNDLTVIRTFFLHKALCFDLLMPICGEVAGGSLREDSLEKLEANIDEKMAHQSEATKESLNWYLDLRRFGGVPLGGFGLGFDRFLQTLTGVANIKDVVPFPRWPHHCYL